MKPTHKIGDDWALWALVDKRTQRILRDDYGMPLVGPTKKPLLEIMTFGGLADRDAVEFKQVKIVPRE